MCGERRGVCRNVNLDWCLRSRPAPAAPQEPAEDGRGAAAAAGEEEERSDGDVKWRETNPPQPALHTCDREEEVRQQTVVTRVPDLLQAHHAAQGRDDGDGHLTRRPLQGIPGEREGVPS